MLKNKNRVFYKFFLVLLIFLGYFGFVAYKYGLGQGFFVTSLTWSFFVFCTPVADAGFLIDFPFRIVTKVKMFVSELIVWIIAIFLNIFAFFVHPEIYSETKLLKLFKHILESPFPFWGIIIISMIGTFASVKFGDDIFDSVRQKHGVFYHKHKNKYRVLVMIFLFVVAIVLYDFLLKKLGLDLSFL